MNEYFATPGPTTDLHRFSGSVDDLPSDPVELAQIVRGLILHEGSVALHGLTLPPERMADRGRVGAAAILEGVLGLDAGPLQVERPVERRMVGYCYHFAVLHCAFLRAKGVPARARCGFAAYFRDGYWIDHWVVEHWSGEEWTLNDPNEGRDFVSRDEFHDAATAWRLCRAADGDPSRYGNHVLWGWDELRGSLVNDVGALNKVEVPEWDWCDLIDVNPRDLPDAAADLMLDSFAGASSFEELLLAYETERGLQPPARLFA